MQNKFKVSIPLAVVITLVAVIYQRTTGPTYPKKFDIGKDRNIQVKLLRSHGGETDAPIEIPALSEIKQVSLTYKRYPTNDDWKSVALTKQGSLFKGQLPNQPPAGKLIYFLNITYTDGQQQLGSIDDPIYIRYKGEVPSYILAPHIFFMFLSMLVSVVALIEAVYGTKSYLTVGRVALGCLFIGGMILGPIVQKFAFGVYWAGFPFDWDLTDNKLLIAVLAWLGAILITWKNPKRWPIICAGIVLFAVYSIPHSMQGSEYDYSKGKVITDLD